MPSGMPGVWPLYSKGSFKSNASIWGLSPFSLGSVPFFLKTPGTAPTISPATRVDMGVLWFMCQCGGLILGSGPFFILFSQVLLWPDWGSGPFFWPLFPHVSVWWPNFGSVPFFPRISLFAVVHQEAPAADTADNMVKTLSGGLDSRSSHRSCLLFMRSAMTGLEHGNSCSVKFFCGLIGGLAPFSQEIFPMIGKILRAFSSDWKTFYRNEDSFKGAVPIIFIIFIPFQSSR